MTPNTMPHTMVAECGLAGARACALHRYWLLPQEILPRACGMPARDAYAQFRGRGWEGPGDDYRR